jgi:hypothetical protein
MLMPTAHDAVLELLNESVRELVEVDEQVVLGLQPRPASLAPEPTRAYRPNDTATFTCWNVSSFISK